MSAALRIRQIQIFPLAIPLRVRFSHAAADRDTADPIIVQLTAGAPYAHHVGYGETLARPYVTGETVESVLEDVEHVFAPYLGSLEAESWAEVLEFAETLPCHDEGRVITAARAAVELALLDLAGRVFRRRAANVAGWLGLPGFGPPGCLPEARYSGVVLGKSRARVRGLLRLQRWYGLRDFKIKIATPGWEERLAWAHRSLARAIADGRATLRADANGGFERAAALAALPLLRQLGVCALEQPLAESDDAFLPELARRTDCHLVADESLITEGDGQRLISGGAVHIFNVRIAKNGGLLPALRLARLALAAGLEVQLGCLVGETSILTAAGIAFLQCCPRVRFVEGAFGRWLLRADVVRRPLRFHRGGVIRPPAGLGLGVAVDERAVRAQVVGSSRVRRF